jgi:hypothetical protein
VQSEGGILTLEDMAAYKVRVLPALSGTYRGKEDYNVYTTHPPTSGGVVLHMLNLMERYNNLLDEGFTGLNAHRAVEAVKCKALLISCDINSHERKPCLQLALRLGRRYLITASSIIRRQCLQFRPRRMQTLSALTSPMYASFLIHFSLFRITHTLIY